MKLDWLAGDTGTRSNMNAPWWIASGVYNSGADRLELQISPGSIRYPNLTGVTVNKSAQTFQINQPQASRYYAIFIRSDETFMVSGTTLSNTVPGPPRHDAEIIGVVFTGASVSTANLKGPWNGYADLYPYEQRGQMAAISAARQRAIYDVRGNANSEVDVIGSLAGDPLLLGSGISFLTFNDAPQSSQATLFAVSVGWTPSGLAVDAGNSPAATTTRLRMKVYLSISSLAGPLMERVHTYDFANDCLPDSALSNRLAPVITSFVALATPPTTAGYILSCSTGDPNTSMRITSITFVALPGLFGSNLIEPA